MISIFLAVKITVFFVSMLTAVLNGMAMQAVDERKETQSYTLLIPLSLLLMAVYIQITAHNPDIHLIIMLGLGIISFYLFACLHAVRDIRRFRVLDTWNKKAKN